MAVASKRTAVAVCALLLILFAIVARCAALTKSPTTDETTHALAGWIYRYHNDFRINPEHPVLWKLYSALGHGPNDLHIDFTDPTWAGMIPRVHDELRFTVDALFQTPGNDGDAFVNRSRLLMVPIAMLLGAVIAWWAWQIAAAASEATAAGPIAAVVAATLFCFDPNFLAHSALVTNDVAMSLVMTLLMICLWRLGQAVTWPRLLAAALVCALGLNVKYSALLFLPISGVVLLARVLLPAPWRALGWTLSRPLARLAMAIGIVAFMGVVGIAGIWACYGFRFAPGVDPAILLTPKVLNDFALTASLDPFAQRILFAERHHLMPQAWLTGVAYVHRATMAFPGYLFGQIGLQGWWYYFPVAMLLKTPLATLAAIALGFLGLPRLARAPKNRPDPSRASLWTTLCLVLPPALYMIVAMTSSMNLGIRHVLPVYPYLYTITAAVAARTLARTGRLAKAIALIAAAVLAVETIAAYPNYIPFFNSAVGSWRNGFHLLGDSNLDWGQDLKLLATWQKAHPNERLYLNYFGSADPAFYGIHYTNLPAGYGFGPPPQEPDAPGVIAISATQLQGIYLPPDLRQKYAAWCQGKPIDILGGSIYLFTYPGR